MESATNLDGARRPEVGMCVVRLISDRQEVRGLLGDRFDAELTYPKIFLDSVGNATPVIVDTGGDFTLVINVADSEAAAVTLRKVRLQTYGHYFDWGQASGAPLLSFSEAVRVAAGPGRLVVAASLPVARAEALGVNSLDVEPDNTDPRVYISRKKRSDVERQWQTSRDRDAAALRPFISNLRRGADLLDALSKSAVGYAALEELMHDAGLDAVFVSSPFHSEMFTGLPRAMAERLGITCLFVRGHDDVIIFSRQPLERSDFRPHGEAASVAEAMHAFGAGTTGIEEGHLGIGPWQSLHDAGCGLKNAAFVLRRWQDKRAGDDLPYYIAAANAVLRGFEKARDHIRHHLAGGMTESDARSAFDRGVADFAAGIGLEGRIKPYFDIIHSGERTLLPATAGDYPLRAADQTIKFDMGLLVLDTFGCVRACSDIARTLSPVAELQDIHDELRTALVDRLIPAMRPGMSGAQVHAAGVDVLRSFIPRMRKAGLMPPGATADGYLRDCGHTIHRTTAGTVYFLPGAKTTIEAGMLGCVEFVWPFERKIIAVEDGYYITDKEVIPFTI